MGIVNNQRHITPCGNFPEEGMVQLPGERRQRHGFRPQT
jgi:hypothetical protein